MGPGPGPTPFPATLLITGAPGTGKTTLLREVAARLGDRRVRGFLTEEIRRGSERVGFALETLGGSRSTLAHVDCPSPHRVGRYRVDLGALEEAAEKALAVEPDVELYLVDEIGKMECLSPRFVERVEALLDSGIPTVATIARSGTGFIERVKRRADVELWELTRYNRDGMLERILGWIAERTRS